MPQLFDASSLTNLIVEGGDSALDIVKSGYVLDLTPYEVGNAIWKMSILQKKIELKNAISLIGTVGKMIKRLNLISVRDIPLTEIMDAAGTNVTFYDASYIVAARLNNLTLITDDMKLATAARKHVKVGSSENLLKRQRTKSRTKPEAK